MSSYAMDGKTRRWVKIVSGKYAEQRCTLEGNVYHTGKNPIVEEKCPS